MYTIQDYSYEKADLLNVKIKPSICTRKKIDIFRKNTGEYICSIGDSRYSDYPTYIKTHGVAYANARRWLYRRRHSHDRKLIGSKGYYADQILW